GRSSGRSSTNTLPVFQPSPHEERRGADRREGRARWARLRATSRRAPRDDLGRLPGRARAPAVGARSEELRGGGGGAPGGGAARGAGLAGGGGGREGSRACPRA